MKAIFLTLDFKNHYLTIRDKEGVLIHYESVDDKALQLHETVEAILDSKIEITNISFARTETEVRFNLK